jgi:hypothetical protein
MDSSLLSLFVVAGVGVILLMAMFILPQRKLPEEKEVKPLYEERCSANWRFARGAVVAGGNIPIARISFYDDFFVVALVTLTKVLYSEVLSTDFKKGWLSKSITINFAKGRSLVIHPKNFEKVRSLIEASGAK